MSNSEKSSKLSRFTDVQKEFIIYCLAQGMSPANTARDFIVMFPTFGDDFDDDDVYYNLRKRINVFKHDNLDKIAEVLDMILEGDMNHIPLARPDFRLRFLQDLLLKPPENVSVLLKIIELADKTTYRLLSSKSQSSPIKKVEFDWNTHLSSESVLAKPPKATKLSEEEDD